MAKLLTMDEAAREMGICTTTLREHVRHGEIPFISLGRGEKRKRRMFDPADLQAFIAARRERETCPSTKTSGAPTTNMTSRCEVLDISVLRAAHRAAKQSDSRKSAGSSRRRRRAGQPASR
ncbi:DNA-binding protein [Xanthobacter tagetidis]|uniref:DNA-binding protein n=1 Tax=Xanthobacter tagetidis TaxID=60216 RepID=A0A3L7ALE8_9HYPH|nr:DNA-binding protein [Xanthobacter tagetidis]